MATVTDITVSLRKLEQEVKQAKLSAAELEGRSKEVTERMHAEFGVKTLDEARVMLARLEGDLKLKEIAIQKAYDELVKNYEW